MSATGKKFAEEFLQIGEVKLEDKVLVQDSEDGLVKYALVDQFNAAAHKEFEDFLKGEDADEIINKWSELEKFLAGLKETDDLATILSEKFNTKDFTKEKIKETLGIYDWALEATPPSGSGADFPLTYDAERDAWELKGNLVITKGLATYTKLIGFTNLDVMGGIKVDRNSIYINDNGELAVVGGAGGGLDESALADYLTTNRYATQGWVTGQKYFTQANFTKEKIKGTLGISDWALAASKPSYTWSEITSKPYKLFYSLNGIGNPDDYQTSNISGYAYASGGGATDGIFASFYSNNFTAQMQFKYNTAIPYVRVYDNTASAWSDWKRIAFHSTFDNYVPLATAKDITAIHNFVNGVKIGGKQITYDSAKNALVLPFNVIVEGGLATYTKLNGFTNLDVMGGIKVDRNSIYINDNGELAVVGGAGGSGGGITLDDVADYLSDNDYITSSGNANSAANIVLGTVSPSSTTSYYPAMVTGTTSGSKYGIKVFGNPVRYALKAGTTSATGIAELILGNSTNSGSSGNSEGALCLYPATSSYYSILKASSNVSGNYTNYLPKSSGTLLNDNSLKTINGYSLVGSGDITISGGTSGDYLPIEGGTLTGPLYVSALSSGAFANAPIRFGSSSYSRISASTSGNLFIYGNQITLRPASTTSASSVGAVLDTSGNLAVTGAVTENSDRNLKNIEYEGDGLDLDVLKKVKVAKWKWKDNKRDKRMHIGGVADNLAEVMPEVVFESQEEDGTTTSSIAYGKAGFSIAASLIAPVSRHEDRIKELEKNIEKMQKELKQLRTA